MILPELISKEPLGPAVRRGDEAWTSIVRWTLNGLILEHFQDIPEAGVSIKLTGIAVEILQTQNRSVVTARIFRPANR